MVGWAAEARLFSPNWCARTVQWNFFFADVCGRKAKGEKEKRKWWLFVTEVWEGERLRELPDTRQVFIWESGKRKHRS